jgi:hypothetical protein
MADFLQRVSQMALGAAPAIRPLVASRYAPGAQGVEAERPSEEPALGSPAPARAVAAQSGSAAPALDAPAASHAGSIARARARSDLVASHTASPAVAADTLEGPRPVGEPAVAPARRAAAERLTAPNEAAGPVRVAARAASNDDARDAAVPLPAAAAAAVDPQRQSGVSDEPAGLRPPVRLNARPAPTPTSIETADATRADRDAAQRDSALPTASSLPDPDPGEGIRARAARLHPGPPEFRDQTAQGAEAEAQVTRPYQVTRPHEVARPQEGGSAPERPVVRVTIGRVEVRAVAPAVPPPLPAPAVSAPRLSLDEYLRQQGRPR